MKHSHVVGGSTAKRVMACPPSVELCAKMPPSKGSNKYADAGTLLHNVIASVLDGKPVDEAIVGARYNDIEITPEMVEDKLIPALTALDEIDPGKRIEYMVETEVGFGDLLPDVYGSCDFIGRDGDRAVVLDWKFGDGVIVEAEENPQLMFYAAAAMRTPRSQWVFEDATEIELIIVQPPAVRRWVTTPERIARFEADLVRAVDLVNSGRGELKTGDHCRWCAAKPVCPAMTGAVDRAVATQIAALPVAQLGEYLERADMVEEWIASVRGLALQLLESGAEVPGYKLVAKRSTRQWISDAGAKAALLEHLPESEVMESSVISPAQAEKKLKKLKVPLPADQVVSISSGNTLAAESDPRPAVVLIGKQLTAALSKIV